MQAPPVMLGPIHPMPLTSPPSTVGRRRPCTAGTTECKRGTLPCCNGCRDLQDYHTANDMNSTPQFSASPFLCSCAQCPLPAPSVGGSVACLGLYYSRSHSLPQHGRHAWMPLALERGFSLHEANRREAVRQCLSYTGTGARKCIIMSEMSQKSTALRTTLERAVGTNQHHTPGVWNLAEDHRFVKMQLVQFEVLVNFRNNTQE